MMNGKDLYSISKNFGDRLNPTLYPETTPVPGSSLQKHLNA